MSNKYVKVINISDAVPLPSVHYATIVTIMYYVYIDVQLNSKQSLTWNLTDFGLDLITYLL